MPGAPKPRKPKAKYEKPTIKQRIATGVAVGVMSGALAFGAIDRVNNPIRSDVQRDNVKSVIEQIDKKQIAVPQSKSKNPNLIRETVNSYNKKAKTGQIYFYDGKKINNVYFDQTRLNQIISIIPKTEKAKIDSLISRKIEKVEATAKQNVVLGKKIIDRVGELDYTKYLLSLTPRELKNAFPEAESAVRAALEKSNPEILKKMNSQHKFEVSITIVLSVLSGMLWGNIILRGKRLN